MKRPSKYAAQFDAMRDSIEGDPTPEEIAELAAIIQDENCERDGLKRDELRAGAVKVLELDLRGCDAADCV
tara:strand:- start:103 stop:315 length:213 start_codon:yes stop_codon:yes gene_type:complete